MIYNVIGLMSGSSHDGLDIAFVEIADVRNDWTYEIKNTACIPFENEMATQLQQASSLSVPEFLKLNTAFGRWIGKRVLTFIQENELFHKVAFIASHGHTVFHDPNNYTSTQIGDGASIAAITGLTTISDLRNMDVALEGQAAPIVPIADRFLFKEYDFCLNLGGICNVTINKDNPLAFDIAPANQVLDFYAKKLGKKFDENGQIAARGTVDPSLLEQLNALSFYQKEAPKSLANTYSQELITIIEESDLTTEADILATLVEHMAVQIKDALSKFTIAEKTSKLLVTGGGAHNAFLMQRIRAMLAPLHIEVNVPDAKLVDHKEALAMALIGVLRWREEVNVLQSVTGALRNSIGGAMWLGNL